ncbi:hypothetical protein R3I93_008504 [Phoxinus phoxinus]|uniref:PDZ domain-containing protein n=1 Tax=Phoxinus phoxinus TaxID=58324 RepID=A0AAN9D488_9TELE
MEEPPNTDIKNGAEKDNQLSELVEVVVETQAEVGASGYSVVGGGERGIFIQEVLRDSPAAKHLSLQKGDQLLSARVYFDNVKYEDALKILQCAEPYKVSFFLKRTVPGCEVSIRPGAQSLELRGPKAKMQRMSVKSVKPFKAKKRRGGRFGLKRLKENKKAKAQAELDIEGSPGKSDLSPVDVEFVFPKFKMRKGGRATADVSGHLENVIASSKKKNIRFPKIKATDAAFGEGNVNVDVATREGEASGAKIKVKAKGPKFGMNFPKLKKTKLDVQSSNDSFEVKGLEAKIKPPSVECDLNMPQGKAETNLEVSVKGKGQGPGIQMPKMNLDVSDTKMTIPKFKLPNVRLSCHSDEMDGEASKQNNTYESNLKTPKIDIKAPNVDLDLNLSKINTVTSLPKLNIDAKLGDDIDGSMVKEQMISLPKLDIAVPKIETSDVDMGLPTLDVTLPKMAAKNIDTERHASTGVKFEVTKLDISLPKIPSPEREVIVLEPEAKTGKFHKPNIIISLPKGKAEGKVEGNTKKGAKVDISLPEKTLEGGADIEGQFGKGGKFKMPSAGVSLTNVKLPEHAITEGPEMKAGELSKTSLEISLPKGKTEVNVEVGELSGKGGKFKMPHLDVSLPKMKLSTGKINTEDPEVKGETFQMPSVDISLPKDKVQAGVEVEGHSGKAEMPKIGLKMPLLEGQIISESHEVSISGVDISLPKGKTDEHIHLEVERGDKFQIPKFDITLPKLKSGESDIDVKIPNTKVGKFHISEIDISLPHIKDERDINMEPTGKCGRVEMPTVDISLPAVKASGVEISLPKMKSSQGDSFEGTDSKRFNMPSVDVSFPKVTGTDEVDVKRHSGKIGKFDMPKLDINLPQMKSTETEIHMEAPEVKGGDLPDVDISLPQGKVKGDGTVKKGGKFKMPKIDLSLPRIKSKPVQVNVKGPESKGSTVHTPSIDIYLPKGKTETNIGIEGHSGTDIKFEMPKIDNSLPKVKDPEGNMRAKAPQIPGGKLNMPLIEMSFPKGKVKGHTDLEGKTTGASKGGKFYMPSIDISLPGEGSGGDVDVEGHAGKGGKIEMPKVDVTLPKLKPSGGEINVEGPDIKGGKFHMPSIDISLPRGRAGGDVDVEGHAGKGGKFEMPKFDVSLPKLKPPGGEIDIEGPDIKGGKFHMPSIDISLPRGRAGGDVDVEGHAGKGGKFEMPKFDVSLPKLKPSGGEINVEGPDIKGGKFHMPSIDISLPRGGAGGDVDVEGHAGKGGKFEMPKVDVSLPKLKPSGGEINIEGPDVKGGKFHMPSIDISLPRGGAGGDVDVEGHAGKGGKFEMPKFDVSLPKLKPPGGEINVEGPDIKGGKFHMPSIDISLPRGGAGGDVDVEGHVGKGGKFEMPKFDVSLPKLKPSGGEVNIEGPDVKGGKFHMPSIDISLPRGRAGGDVDVEGHAGKGRKFEMPKVDVSLPKLKPSGDEINVEGPDIKGGKFHMPSIDISLPRGRAGGDVDVEGHAGKGGKFEMPKVDVSLPKFKPSGGEINVEGPDVRGGKFHMPSIDISLPGTTDSNAKTKATGAKMSDLNVPEATLSGNIKLPTVKIPTVDISAPKVDLDFTLPMAKGRDKDNIELLKAEGGRPSSGASFDIPDVSVKMPKISLPKFGRKLKGGDKLELESPGLSIDLDVEKTSPSVEIDAKTNKSNIKMPSIGTSKKDIEIIGPEAEIKIKADTGEITKPEIRVEGPDDKVRYKLKFPKFKTTTPKAKLKDVDMDMPAVDNKGKVKMPAVEISLPTANIPECEVLLPKTEVDVSEADIRGYEGSLKIPKMPTIGISVPKVDLDVSLPRVKLHKPEDSKSSDLNIDSNRGMVNVPHVKIPKVDLSLPHGKTGDTGIHEVEIGKRGKLRMPEVEISLPHVKKDTCNADIEIKGEKMSMPNVDISLPHGKTKETDYPDSEFGAKGSKLKMADITVPKIDLSLPRGSKGESHAPDSEVEGGKLKMPTVDISLPKIKSKDIAPELQPGEGKGKVTIPGIKLPTVDISLPHGKIEDIDTLELGACGKEGKFKSPNIKIPKVDISLEGQHGNTEKTEVRKQGGNFQLPKITMPKVDISLPYGKTGNTEASGSVEVEGGQHKMPDIKIPQVDISLPKGKTGEFYTKEVESGGGVGKFTMSNVKIPKVDIVMSSDADMSVSSTDAGLKDAHKEGKKMGMPTTHIEGPSMDLELDLGLSKKGKKNKKKTELPEIDLSPSAPKEKIKGTKVKGSKFNIGMPKVKVSVLETDITKSGKKDATFIKEGTDANLKADLPAPKIPELDFDIETAQVDTNHSEEDKKQTGKVKIPKFGIPLPSLSSPEVNIASSRVKGHSINVDSEVEYEGPRMPKVTKAVFVMVNPQTESAASVGGEASAEIGDEKLKLPKIKMKSSFGKSRSNEKGNAVNLEQEVETEGKSKTGKLKLPKVTFSSGQRGSFDVTPSGSDDGTSLNGDKDEKAMFGKLKLPKLEFFSPYSKETVQEEEMETSMTRLRKETSGESKESKETKSISGTVRETDTLVYSKARTEMLAEREGSESPIATVSTAFVSVKKSEERQETTCFKVPKFTLSPHSTGILHITPESSPKGSKSSLHCSSEEASGGFYVKMPSLEYLTHEMSSEHLITKTEGTRTVVTKTTKYTETKSSSSKQ